MTPLISKFLTHLLLVFWPQYVAVPFTASNGSLAAPVFSTAGTPCDSGGGTTCSVTISVSSGSLVVGVIANGGFGADYASVTMSDSNSDTSNSCPNIIDAGGGRQAQLFYLIAGAALTSVNQTITTPNGNSVFLNVFVYSNPASLTTSTILDQCMPSAQNENVTSWTSGTSLATTNSTDMLFGFFWTAGTTYTAGSGFTSRGTSLQPTTAFAEDKTLSSTGTQAATSTTAATGFGPGVGAAFK